MYYCILAGGKSRRMGKDKALLQFGGYNCVEVLLERFCAEGDDVCLSLARQGVIKNVIKDITVVEDKVNDAGPLGAIYSVLSELRQDIFVVAVDMPFADVRLAKCLMDIGRRKSDSKPQMIILERIDKKREMLFGFYSYTCLEKVREMLLSGTLKLGNLCDKVNCVFVSEAEIAVRYGQGWEMALFNMNRPEDYAFALLEFNQME